MAADNPQTIFVRVVRELGPVNVTLGTSAGLNADATGEKAVAVI
jgi:hypothetical protein